MHIIYICFHFVQRDRNKKNTLKSSRAWAPRDSFLFSAATMACIAFSKRFCSSNVSTKSEFQTRLRSDNFRSSRFLYSPCIFFTPSCRVSAVLKTAACVCMVFCMFRRKDAVGIDPFACRRWSKFATDDSPAFC